MDSSVMKKLNNGAARLNKRKKPSLNKAGSFAKGKGSVSKKTRVINPKTISRIVDSSISQEAQEQRPKESKKTAKAIVFLTGETPLVKQFADLCYGHGYDVCVSFNDILAPKQHVVSSGITNSTSIPANTSLAIELTNIDLSTKKKNLEKLAKALPETVPILSSSITVTATEQSSWISGKHRLVGIAALPTFIDKPFIEVAPTIYSPKETLNVVSRFFLTMEKGIEIVQDRIGMVLPRILCQVINEAAFAITDDIAAPEDIDKVLTLGMQFPLGPFQWAENIGLDQVYAVLAALQHDLQEERYRIAPILKQMALTGVWWNQAKAESTDGKKS
jgi:3-hydroxybutyryl-CoA dehydrogenase